VASADGLLASALAKALLGHTLDQLCVGDGDMQLNFTGNFNITLESAISVVQTEEVVAPPYALEGIALLLPLLNSEVTDVVISDSGDLVVTFGETTVRCGGGSGFEPWHFSGPSGEKVVSLPSGGLAIWPAR
jgi:hypothetical protein